MTHALVPLRGIRQANAANLASSVAAAYSAGEHPHMPAGSPAGGQFAPKSGGNSGGGKKAPARKGTVRKAPAKTGTARRQIPKGQLGFDGVSGTGYGSGQGDARVKSLQSELVRLGLTDAKGKRLKKDGLFGPRTTEAVKEAQRRLGMNPTGIISPSFIDRLKTLHTLPAKGKATTKPSTRPSVKPVKAASDEPYGDVGYADPGYQPDGKKRYPLDSEAHCRAAWSYINQADNAGKYTADQLSRIKTKIKAAGRKYGITFADDSKRTAAAASLEAVELARPGTWQLSSGTQTFTEAMLRDAARYAGRPGARPSPVKLGHIDARFDGEPALGWLANLRVEEDDAGPVLLGDITGMPDWLAAAAPHAWPDRSVEGWTDYLHDGESYSFVIDGLALLGVTPPGIGSIKSLRDLPQALGVAASARIVATLTAPATDPAPPADATQPIQAEEAGHMADPAKLREALGLPADASDDETRSTALAAFGLTEEPEEPEGEPVVAAKLPPAGAGTVVLASSVWEETQNTIKKLTAHVDKQKRDERDDVIAKAVIAGKFTPAQRQHFSRLWDADPDGTRTLIEQLTPNSALAVLASGYAGDADDVDSAYAALYGRGNAQKAG